MELLFLDMLIWWPPLGYILIFLAMVFEGDIALFTAAFLTNLGLFDPGDALVTALLGVLIGDWLWYEAGKHIHRLPAFLATRVEKLAAPFDEKIKVRPFRILLLTKFAYGIHHLILLRSGASGLRLSRFFAADLPASLIWVAVVGSLGYFFGASLFGAERYLKFGEVGILAGVILLFIAEKLIRRFSRRT